MLAHSNYSPYTCQRQCVFVKWTIRCNWAKVCSHGTAQLRLQVTLAVLDSTGSICIKAVASKIMHSVISKHVTYIAVKHH